MHTTLPRNPVGNTGLQVPVLGLGTAPIANLYRDISEGDAISTVHAALEHGLTFIDTAPLYGNTLSETRVGLALRGVPRESYVLASKVGQHGLPDGARSYDFSRDGVLRSLEASLDRLGVTSLDIVHIHDADNHFKQALEAAFPALAELRDQGVIRAVGAGMNQWRMLLDFAAHADFDCFLLAGRYTLLEQGALGALEVFRANNIGVFAGGVFNSGILATGPQEGAKYNYAAAPPEVLARARRLHEVCTRHGVPLRVVAQRFVHAHPAITSLVIGADSPGQVLEAVEALNTSVPPALWQELKDEGLIAAEAPVPA